MSKKRQIEYYEGLLAKFGADFKTLDWNSPESQKLRFKIFQEIFVYGKKAADITVLDVGCGFGDLFGFFKNEKLLSRHKIRYTGTDISSKILDVAREKYPDIQFEMKDILEAKDLPRFDYVFCSGVFNIRTMDVESHMEWVRAMLEKMHDLANHGVAVNFLSEGALPLAEPEGINAGRYFYFSPDEIVWLCRHMGSRYILRHDYHPGDFTVYLLK
jgi:2-polyprenyl-3-methyl-5-hydroxy-6-metoxy-1,4-benzoquinol methylase